MGFWKDLFRGAPPSPRQESQWDRIKRAGDEEAQRLREALERTPRATPEQLAARIATLRSIDQVNSAYNQMRHSDFCDAVAEAVRSGNFSDPDATHALYVREWVLTGGAIRTSFPDWLDSEGRARFSLLTERWLRSGEKHTTFNNWLVGAIAPKPTSAPPQAVPETPQRPETKSTEQKVAEPPADNGRWRYEGSRLVCEHEVTGVLEPHTKTTLRIECSLSRYLSGTVDTNLYFYVTPYLYLMPNGKPFEAHLVTAPFVLGLVADGSGKGTQTSPLVQGGMFEVNASANEDGPDTAILNIISSRDTILAVRTFAIGKDLTFTLVDYETEPPVKLRLRLTGDPNFAALYERLRQSM